MLTVRELNDKQEMLDQISVIQELYPSLTLEEYGNELDFMLPLNYGQVAVFEDETCVGISGYWLGSKLWCGKYLELDNIIVVEKARSAGVGQLIFDFLQKKASEANCNFMSLDSYTQNFKAHKFFYNNDFNPKGFHFIKFLNPEKVR